MGDLLGPPPTPGTGEGWVARPLNAELQYWALFGLAGWGEVVWWWRSGVRDGGGCSVTFAARGDTLIAD